MKPTTHGAQRRLAELFAVVDPASLRAYFKVNKKQLMVRAKLLLDNIPTEHRKLCGLASRIPETEYVTLLEALEPVIPNELPAFPDAISTLTVAAEMIDALSTDELKKCRWAVLLAWLNQSSDEALVSYMVGHGTAPAEAPPESVQFVERTVEPVTVQTQTALQSEIGDAARSSVRSIEKLDRIDEEVDEVVVRWRGIHPNFAEVVGVRRLGVWHSLSDGPLRKNLFPHSGDLYIPSDKPLRGEFAAWKVRHQIGEKSAEFRAVSEAAIVYRVMNLQVTSDKPETVRVLLQQQVESSELSRTIFRLTDGLAFKLKAGTSLGSGEFHEPAVAWSNLNVFESHGHEFVIAPLPPSDTTYDLADIPILVKRVLLQADTFEHFPKFSKSEVTALANWFRDKADASALARRIDQIVANLNDIVVQRAILDALRPKIMELDYVKAEVEKRVAEAEREQISKRTKALADIEELKRQRDLLRRQVEADKDKALEASGRIMKAARKAFEKAIKEGEEKIGDVAVLSALLGRGTASGGSPAAPVWTDPPDVEIERVQCDQPLSYSKALASLGIQKQRAELLGAVLSLAHKVGIAVAFKGSSAAFIAQQIARLCSNGSGVIVRVAPGTLRGDAISGLIENGGDLQTISLVNANSSAFEAYGHPIDTLIWSRVLSDAVGFSPAIFLSISDAPFALPLGRSCGPVLCVIDLDSPIAQSLSAVAPDEWADVFLEKVRENSTVSPVLAKVIRKIGAGLQQDASAELLGELTKSLLNPADASPL